MDESIFILSETRLEELLSSKSLSFEELCELVAGMTDRNLHTEVRIKIAEWLKHVRLTKLYKSIMAIQDVENELPESISEYRREKDRELEHAIRYYLRKDQAERLISTM